MSDSTPKLTAKQEMFCKEYLVDLNATQAAIRAGYSEDTAATIGCENLTKPNVAEYVAKLKEERNERVKIDGDWVLKRAVEINDRCMQTSQPLDKEGNIVSGAEFKFEPAGANKSLELIAKHTDVNCLSNNLNIKAVVKYEDLEDEELDAELERLEDNE